MSVTFYVTGSPEITSACELCDGTGRDWQSPAPEGPFDPIEPEHRCWCCENGVTMEPLHEPINLGNASAGAVLALLGLSPGYGSLDRHEAARVVLKARNALPAVDPYVIPDGLVTHGEPAMTVVEIDGLHRIEPSGAKVWSFGLDADEIVERVERVLALFERAIADGFGVNWS